MTGRIRALAVAGVVLLAGLAGSAQATPVGEAPASCDSTIYCPVYITDSSGNAVTNSTVALEMGTTAALVYADTDSYGLATFEIDGDDIYCPEDTATLILANPPAGHQGWVVDLVFNVSPPVDDSDDGPVREWDFGDGPGWDDDCLDYGGWKNKYPKVAYKSMWGLPCPF